MDRNIWLHSNEAKSTLRSLIWPYCSWRKCFTLEKSSKPLPRSLSSSSSRSLCLWSLLSVSWPQDLRCPRWGHQWATNNRAKLCQVAGASGEWLCVQRSSWGNPGVTLGGKGGLYLWKHFKKSRQSYRKCLFTLLLHRFNCGNICQSQFLTSCAQHYINKAEEAAPWSHSYNAIPPQKKGQAVLKWKGLFSDRVHEEMFL